MLASLAKKAESNLKVNGNDYEKNGLVYCGNCNSPRQTIVRFGNTKKKVACMCKCECEAYEKQKELDKKQKRMDMVNRLRTDGIKLSLQGCTFESDDGTRNRKQMAMAKRYVEKWQQIKDENIGLLFWGDTGNGKTFTAACIANELVSRGVPVLMTSFPKILSMAQGMYSDEKKDYIQSLNNYDLLIVDDLGVERHTDFGFEIVYSVIDQRYIEKLPIIITTNLTAEEMKNPKELRTQRIYDRVNEMCVPVRFDGDSKRKEIAEEKIVRAREILRKDE